MTVSLMSLLGGNAALSADAVNSAAEKNGMTILSGKQIGAAQSGFDAVLAANELQDISVEDLRAFFTAHGIDMPMQAGGQTANEVLAKVIAAQDGQKLPGDVMMALQEMLSPEAMADVSVDAASVDASMDVFAQLPQRELTPEELSELVQETGLPPVVIFAALQNTPSASPNLAAAMVEGVGEQALTGTQQNAAMQGQAALQNAETQAQIAKSIAAMMQKGLSREEAAQLSNQLASVDFSALHMEKQDVLKRIAAVMGGEKMQGEFDWNVKPVAANANQAVETKKAQNEGPSLLQQSKGDVEGKTTAAPQNAQLQTNAAKGQAEQALLQQTGQGQVSQQNAAPSHDSSASQQVNFATTLEQSTALRSMSGNASLDAQLRHAQTPQQDNVTEQVEVRLRNALADGSRRMEIHLKPAELGRVDVRIDTDADGRSHVTVTADKRDTLDMLQRDARALERALNEAGLKADSNNLSFNLRGEDQQQADNGQKDKAQKATFDINGEYADEMDSKLDTSEMALTYDAGRAYRLNLDWGVDISV